MEESHPREIELKIVHIPDPAVFLVRVAEMSRVKTPHWRLLHDDAYRPRHATVPHSLEIEIPKRFVGVDNFLSQLTFLGCEKVQVENGHLICVRPVEMPKRTVRIRLDEGKVYFTVKDKPPRTAECHDRIELEHRLSHSRWLHAVVDRLFYYRHSIREKLRASFPCERAQVDVQIAPGGVPVYAEIEGHTQEAVWEMVDALRISREHAVSMSDTKYFATVGIPDDQSRIMHFEKPFSVSSVLRQHGLA